MARNEEKSQSMLNRYMKRKRESIFGVQQKARFASECKSIGECEKMRKEFLKEIGKLVQDIQNEHLGEHRLRDLNDLINKKMKSKRAWEHRIIELGGPNYLSITDFTDGAIVNGSSTYRYFGAAKKLPGVKELFETHTPSTSLKTRTEIYKGINSDYYGFKDDEDGVLLKLEVEQEKILQKSCLEDYESRMKKRKETQSGEEEEDIVEEENEKEVFLSHVWIPTKQEIENIIIRKRKQELLGIYATESFQKEMKKGETNVKNVLGIDKN
eukprot:TRINITY_DN727_c0_g1_i2.p1 TRINITY_DN727_c0_g1~~TRINITY_DN727_c0_g1_i2.p1  ORF type:complete len:269 (-),score=89.85 TRINITY_DN727_c0_g1_i2:57-863(-)